MRNTALLCLSLVSSTYCPEGWSTGINSFAGPDPENTSRCYPTAEMARVTKCTSKVTGEIHFEVHIKKQLGDRPAGFSDFDSETWSRVFHVNELTKSGTKHKLFLMTNVHIPGKYMMFNGMKVQKSVAVNLLFLCQYSLKEQNVREEFSVTGQDIAESRKSTGSLKYILKIRNDDLLIGDTIDFDLIPMNPNVVYALVTKCYVVRGTHQVTIFGEDDNYCYNPFIGFEIVSGFSSQGTQHFRYNAFKWSTDRAETIPEEQGVLCQIKLSGDPFKNVPEPKSCQAEPPVNTPNKIVEDETSKGNIEEQERVMLNDVFNPPDYEEEEEIEEKEEEEEFQDLTSGHTLSCSEQPFKAVLRKTRLQNGGRIDSFRDSERHGTVDECGKRCMRKPGCGAFNYHKESRSCVYKGIPKDGDYTRDTKKGYTGYEIRPECRRPFEEVETTMSTTTSYSMTTTTTTWFPTTTTTVYDICTGMNAAAQVLSRAQMVLPGQVIDGGSKGWKLDQQDHYGEVEECIQVCASIPGCAGFLYMIDYDYCEFRHEQKKDFIFFDESDIEESDKYMSVLLKDECKTKAAESESNVENLDTTSTASWSTTWPTTTTQSECAGSSLIGEVRYGEVVLGEIIHWRFPKSEHYGTPEQCSIWCSQRAGCGGFLHYPTYRYCEYKNIKHGNQAYLQNESTEKYDSYILNENCITNGLTGMETTTTSTSTMTTTTDFGFPDNFPFFKK